MLSGLGMVGVSGCGSAGAGAQNNYSSVVLGLASLILEGRPIADDEYQQQTVGVVGSGAAAAAGSGEDAYRHDPPPPGRPLTSQRIPMVPWEDRKIEPSMEVVRPGRPAVVR